MNRRNIVLFLCLELDTSGMNQVILLLMYVHPQQSGYRRERAQFINASILASFSCKLRIYLSSSSTAIFYRCPMQFRACLFIALFLPVASALSQIQPIPRFEIREDGALHLENVLKEFDSTSSPGFSVLVGTADSILHTYETGLANLESRVRITPVTPFYIASIGKTMTAFAILKLREAGLLSLEMPISTFIPDVGALCSDVTIMHLLTHQSGIPDYYKHLEDTSSLTNDVIVAFVAGLDSLSFTPGHSYAYSNTAYVLLAEVIEQVSGVSYADYIAQTFLKPLAMHHTVVADSPTARPNNAVTGYAQTDSSTWQIHDRETYVTGPGGLYSTAKDLYLWYKAITSNKVVSRRWTELAFHMPSTLSGQVSYMTMGWFNETFGRRTPELEGLPVIGSLGSYRGFRTLFYIFPQQELVAILLENTGSYSIGGQEIANGFLKKE